MARYASCYYADAAATGAMRDTLRARAMMRQRAGVRYAAPLRRYYRDTLAVAAAISIRFR